MDERLFSGSVDGTLKVWDISDLKTDIISDSNTNANQSKITNLEGNSLENRSDIDSGIDVRDDHNQRKKDMV